jgi:hypothetical protein
MGFLVFFLLLYLVWSLRDLARPAPSPPEKESIRLIANINIKGVPPEAIRVTEEDGQVTIEIDATKPPSS